MCRVDSHLRMSRGTVHKNSGLPFSENFREEIFSFQFPGLTWRVRAIHSGGGLWR